MRLTIDLDGDVQLDRELARLIGRVQDTTPAFQRIARQLAAAESKQFTTQGAYASGGWAPLSPAYRRWKVKHYPGKKILERTGKLKASLTRRPFGVERIRPHDMEIGTDVTYARFHQHGTPNLPRRRPLELTDTTRAAMTKTLQSYVFTGRT